MTLRTISTRTAASAAPCRAAYRHEPDATLARGEGLLSARVRATQAREEATKAAEERARQVAALKAKDFEGTEKLLQQRIQTLDALIAEKNGRIDALQAELSEATIKVRDIALKAIEGASGAAALTHVSGIALQQAKGRDDRS